MKFKNFPFGFLDFVLTNKKSTIKTTNKSKDRKIEIEVKIAFLKSKKPSKYAIKGMPITQKTKIRTSLILINIK